MFGLIRAVGNAVGNTIVGVADVAETFYEESGAKDVVDAVVETVEDIID